MSSPDQTAPKYSWKSGYPHRGVDALNAWRALERLSQENTGLLTPRQVVEAARPTESVLHSLFEWDDAAAAEAHRFEQAGCLMRAIQVHYEVQPERIEVVRALQNVTVSSEKVYVSTIRALKEEDLRRQVIAAALRELTGWASRYRQYTELSEVIAKIEHMLRLTRDENDQDYKDQIGDSEAA